LAEALGTIRRGGVVALAFERLFGLAANALDRDAVARVAAIKSREERSFGARPISIILPDLDGVEGVTEHFSPLSRRLADRFWPGPLTLVVPAASTLPRPLVSVQGLVGIRLAGPSPAALLAARAGVPLTATSANRAGETEALSHSELLDLEGVDLIVKGTVPGPPGSTVVDASENELTILRQGIIRVKEDM
jgi:L-threonylcarbamoyladenylate synthase